MILGWKPVNQTFVSEFIDIDYMKHKYKNEAKEIDERLNKTTLRQFQKDNPNLKFEVVESKP